MISALAAQAGLLMMKALLEDEVAELTGPRYAHDERRQANRWGQEDGYVVFAGRKVPLLADSLTQGTPAVDAKEDAARATLPEAIF